MTINLTEKTTVHPTTIVDTAEHAKKLLAELTAANPDRSCKVEICADYSGAPRVQLSAEIPYRSSSEKSPSHHLANIFMGASAVAALAVGVAEVYKAVTRRPTPTKPKNQ